LAALDHVFKQQSGEGLGKGADEKNRVAVRFAVGAIAELAGTEYPASAFIDESDYDAGICLVKVVVKERADAISLSIGEIILGGCWRLSGKPKAGDEEEWSGEFHSMMKRDHKKGGDGSGKGSTWGNGEKRKSEDRTSNARRPTSKC
jgi:hypothetical protein